MAKASDKTLQYIILCQLNKTLYGFTSLSYNSHSPSGYLQSKTTTGKIGETNFQVIIFNNFFSGLDRTLKSHLLRQRILIDIICH